jgi:hypothetical protein
MEQRSRGRLYGLGRTVKIRAVIAQLCLLAGSTSVLMAQQSPPSRVVFTGQRVTLTTTSLTPDGVGPAGPATVCLAPSGLCFTPDSPFGLSPDATVVQVGPNQEALLFTAVASASGSGSTKLLALLQVRSGKLDDLSPGVKISEQGEYQDLAGAKHFQDRVARDGGLCLGCGGEPFFGAPVQDQHL